MQFFRMAQIESELYGVVVSSVGEKRELTYVSRGALIFVPDEKFLSPSDFTFTQSKQIRHFVTSHVMI